MWVTIAFAVVLRVRDRVSFTASFRSEPESTRGDPIKVKPLKTDYIEITSDKMVQSPGGNPEHVVEVRTWPQ